ncbi:OmpA family protein [Pseudomonas sp. FEN]|uniref:OmpA family protein n=1 Tax=Pseudomonas sp. FEN TaxID=2767468 RepID=UPI00174AFA1A|nr:OmpA family protein [Pseudomonas sp. FEN]CAD5199869.1 Outer membrane protein A precursor [Pseudomonas sp. FEN]
MARSKKWWWGLPLLALLWLAVNWIKTPEVEQDLRTRVESASDGAAMVVAGRDVTLPNATKPAHDAADQTYGVRQVIDSQGSQPVTPVDGSSERPPGPAPAMPSPAVPEPASAPEPASPPTTTPADEPQANQPGSTGSLDAKACEQQFAAALSQYKVRFGTAQDILSADSKAALDALVATARACPDEQIEVDGYTDNTGQADFNLALSTRRAEAVVAYLAQHGVSPEHLKAVGFGESHPVAANDTPEGQAENRRIEMKVMDDSAATPPTDAK